MIIELAIALTIGIAAGTFTGLSPGIHINLVAAMLLAALAGGVFVGIPIIALVVFIVSMSRTHTFLDFIPSVYLGAPNEDTALAVLPGHELLLEGKGHEAVVTALYGSLFALPLALVLSGVFVLFLPTVFSFMKAAIAFVLIFVSLYLVFREREFLIALMIFLLAGFLGWFAFNLPVKEPLLPLLSGLFGISGLLLSFSGATKIPEQEIPKLREVKLEKGFLKSLLGAGIAAPLCSFLPGIGSGHASVIGSEISGFAFSKSSPCENSGDQESGSVRKSRIADISEQEQDPRGFILMVGAINTIVMGLSFVTAYSIGKGRTGSAAAVQELLGKIGGMDLIAILISILIAGGIAFFVGLFLSKIFAKYVMKIPYRILSIIVISAVVFVNIILSNWIGLIVLITGTALGVFCIVSGVRRIQMMGCLLVPSIIYYLTI